MAKKKRYIVRLHETSIAEVSVLAKTADDAIDAARDRVDDLEFTRLGVDVGDVIRDEDGTYYQQMIGRRR